MGFGSFLKELDRDEYWKQLLLFQTLFRPNRPLQHLHMNSGGVFRLSDIGPYSLLADPGVFKSFSDYGLQD